MPSGRRLLLAFAGGAIAAALLLALPLVTVRDRVAQLEEANHDLELSINRTAGDQLLAAGDAVGAANLSPEAAPAFTRAAHRLDTAGRLTALTAGPNDGTPAAMNATADVLDRLAETARCGLLTPTSPPATQLPGLATVLTGLGEAMRNGQAIDARALTAPAASLTTSLDTWARQRVAIENATLHLDDERIEVTLGGPLPAAECRGELTVEVCRISERTEGCLSIAGTSGRFEQRANASFAVDAMRATDTTEAFRVTVSDTDHGQPVEATCQMPAREGASCTSS